MRVHQAPPLQVASCLIIHSSPSRVGKSLEKIWFLPVSVLSLNLRTYSLPFQEPKLATFSLLQLLLPLDFIFQVLLIDITPCVPYNGEETEDRGDYAACHSADSFGGPAL